MLKGRVYLLNKKSIDTKKKFTSFQWVLGILKLILVSVNYADIEAFECI